MASSQREGGGELGIASVNVVFAWLQRGFIYCGWVVDRAATPFNELHHHLISINGLY